MSKRVKLNIDGSILTLMTNSTEEHVQRVGRVINDTIENIKKRNSTLNLLQVYRYAMISIADELLEIRELVNVDELRKDVSSHEYYELRNRNKHLEEENQNLIKRLEKLQEILTKKSEELEELKHE